MGGLPGTYLHLLLGTWISFPRWDTGGERRGEGAVPPGAGVTWSGPGQLQLWRPEKSSLQGRTGEVSETRVGHTLQVEMLSLV